MIPQIWDQYDDLLPKVSIVGLNKQKGTGVAYESLTSMVPLSILVSMGYDVFNEKNKFYFSSVYEGESLGDMYVFSLKQVIRSRIDGIIFQLEKTGLVKRSLDGFDEI